MSKRKLRPTCCLRRLGSDPLPSTVITLSPSDTDIVTQYRLQKAKSEITFAQKNAKANIDFITNEQQNVSVEIQSLRKAIKDLEFLISSSRCKTIHPKKLADFCKVKSSLQVDLSNALHHENLLKHQLHQARNAYRNARLDDHMVNEDIKKFKNKSWDVHAFEKSVLEQRRLERELQCKKNAISAREETITSVANSITAHVLQKLPGEHNVEQKQFREARSARQSVNKYFAKSLRTTREHKAVSQTENQIRQRRQKENLSRLKHEINEIKKTLAVKSHLRQIHNEEIAVEKQEVKNLLQAQGANPYLAEYLLAIEEKQRELQRKMLVEEQKRLLEMQREYSIIEASKTKEEGDRKKWDQFWSKRAMDRLMSARKSQLEMYFDIPGDEEDKKEHLNLKTELQEKVAEQLHERLSLGPHAFTDQIPPDDDEDNEEEEEESLMLRKSRPNSEISSGKGRKKEIVPEEALQFKPRRQSEESAILPKVMESKISQEKDKLSVRSKSKSRAKSSSNMLAAERSSTTVVEASLRKAIHLEDMQKESLIRIAGAGENTKAILMNGRNVFDFGIVPVGQRKYMMVNVANIGTEPVQLKMSVLNPYGPFSFCNSLKVIPHDSYFSLKFKYQPTEMGEESQETIKIEEVGKPENFIIIKFKGYAIGWGGE